MPRRPLVLLALACASAIAAATVWFAALLVPGGRLLDAGAMGAFVGFAQPPRSTLINGVADLADPLALVLGGAVLTMVAVARRRRLMAALVPVVLVSANVCTQLLKPALADLRIVDLNGIQTSFPDAWPSGHSTVAMSLALCLVVVVGPRMRPLAAVAGAGYAIAVGYALVALAHHLPSDVLGGYLVAGTFALLGASVLASLEARHGCADRRVRAPAPIAAPAAAGSLVALLGAGALVGAVRSPDMAANVLEHPTAVLAGLSIAALGLALTTGLAVALRR